MKNEFIRTIGWSLVKCPKSERTTHEGFTSISNDLAIKEARENPI